MTNSSFFTADRTTHIKIVVVSLLASITVMVVGIAARPQVTSVGEIQAIRTGVRLDYRDRGWMMAFPGAHVQQSAVILAHGDSRGVAQCAHMPGN